ncbi:MAG: helix-turn-helix domain-containing protein [Clostridia bacterium]|nr:helix-turn-helix domain-containing protein [Clostridia bacterium]
MGLENFPEILKELIVENLANLTEVSEELECGESTLSRYTSGKALPTLEMTVRLADYFSVTTDYLLGLDEDNVADKFKACPPFSKRFPEVLKYFHTSRYKLQQMTGIAESVMRYWVQGKTTPTIANVVKIAQALGCTVDFLLGREK